LLSTNILEKLVNNHINISTNANINNKAKIIFLSNKTVINHTSDINKGDIGNHTSNNNEIIISILDTFIFFQILDIFSNLPVFCSIRIFQTLINDAAFKKL